MKCFILWGSDGQPVVKWRTGLRMGKMWSKSRRSVYICRWMPTLRQKSDMSSTLSSTFSSDTCSTIMRHKGMMLVLVWTIIIKCVRTSKSDQPACISTAANPKYREGWAIYNVRPKSGSRTSPAVLSILIERRRLLYAAGVVVAVASLHSTPVQPEMMDEILPG